MLFLSKIEKIRENMKKMALQAYIITGFDPHLCEYTPKNWQTREWLIGFTGSAGIIVVTDDAICFWTDFRYHLQAEKEIDSDYDQVKLCRGYDHNFVINPDKKNDPKLAATVFEPGSGRYMKIYTTEPGVQFYSANFLFGITGKSGKPYPPRGAFCLETQHFPDSPNKPEFPTVVLRPGDTYKTSTIHKFLVK